jgi:hypothetical protein
VAWTFGGGTGDDVTLSMTGSMMATSRIQMVMGWWRPTTLTATRKLWSVNTGGVAGCEIDSTTSQIRLKIDATTDGEWTAPVGLTVDQWKFLAMVCSINTVSALAWRVWAGTYDTAPAEVTVTQVVAPASTVTGSSNLYVGNAGTGTLAFQGDIADVVAMVSLGSGDINHMIPHVTRGVITTDEAEYLRQLIVEPTWRGDYSYVGRCATRQASGSTNAMNFLRLSGPALSSQVIAAHGSASGDFTQPKTTSAVNVTTTAYQAHPRPLVGPMPTIGPSFVHRR